MKHTYSIKIGNQTLSLETGKIAKQANAAIVATQGETVVLCTACMTDKPREGLDFFPLLVDFEERYYAAGKIPGGFIKREGRPSQGAILSARVIDRSIRSLFEDWMRHDVQVVATVMAFDQENTPSIMAINAASVALMISDIPWGGPVGAVKIGCINGELVVNPTETQLAESTLDLTVAGHAEGITMVESGSKEVSETLLVDAMELAQNEILKIVQFQQQIRSEIGKAKVELKRPVVIDEIDSWIEGNLKEKISKAVMIHGKKDRSDAIAAIREEAVAHFSEDWADAGDYIGGVVEHWVKTQMRTITAVDKVRADGRGTDVLRNVACEIDVLPRVHGSALFTRGETQALVVTTLGMLGEDDQLLDGIKLDEPNKRFLLHYNFPSYSVGEVRPMRGPGRREIGHGALAERAILPVIPSEEEFPYVMRVVSDILESNGSSSQASVCGGSLSLMSAGVPISKHVAGIAMGLIKEGEHVVILTDIQGLEDHYGDMDFKVAGTRDGVTALQMDNKAGGITRQILEEALEQARRARMEILDVMEETIATPAPLSPNAPRMLTMKIDVEKIRDVIGSGGKVIRGIIQDTGAKVSVEDDGQIFISGPDIETAERAQKMIHDIVRDVVPGEVFYGKVTRLMAFGAFVELLPGKEGLLHVSEISTQHVGKVEDVFQVGDPVLVVVKEIDDMNRINLSRRRILGDTARVEAEGLGYTLEAENAREEKIKALAASAPPREQRPQGDRDRDRGSRNNDRGGDRNSRDRGPRRN